MGHYTEFYFRAKLRFDTPASVKTVLQRQFDMVGLPEGPLAWMITDSNTPHEDVTSAPDGLNWAGHGELPEPHLFFSLPRACSIPHSNNWSNKQYPHVFKQQADGGCLIEFGCEFKNYDNEVEQFLDWITPYVRLRFGKRNRGRRRQWVGWYQSESMEERRNIYVESCATPKQPSMLLGRKVYIDWRS